MHQTVRVQEWIIPHKQKIHLSFHYKVQQNANAMFHLMQTRHLVHASQAD